MRVLRCSHKTAINTHTCERVCARARPKKEEESIHYIVVKYHHIFNSHNIIMNPKPINLIGCNKFLFILELDGSTARSLQCVRACVCVFAMERIEQSVELTSTLAIILTTQYILICESRTHDRQLHTPKSKILSQNARERYRADSDYFPYFSIVDY